MAIEAGEVLLTPGAQRRPACDCLERVSEHIRAENGEVMGCYGSGAAIVYTRRLDTCGAHPPIVVASYCPFCGDAYS